MSSVCSEHFDLRVRLLESMLDKVPQYQALTKELGQVKYSIAECPFGASVDLSSNEIFLDPRHFHGSLPATSAIQAALFEIANLFNKNNFKDLVGRIESLPPDAFVEQYERIEHRSALLCKKALREFLPKEKWSDYPMAYTTENFQLHYLMQQLAGHSQKVFEKYRAKFSPNLGYVGSLRIPIEKEEVKYLRQFIDLIIMMEDPDHPLCKKAAECYLRMKAAAEGNTTLPKHLLEHLQEIEISRDAYTSQDPR
ncbi:MAG: hypothetical protein JSR39_00275 [Verrucomicrobia bacterium]|nr:hypothetical protein [Verrucomicrobiota bacterium]